MKICLIVKPGHLDSGVGRYAANLENALRRAGLEVVVAYPQVPLPGLAGEGCTARLGLANRFSTTTRSGSATLRPIFTTSPARTWRPYWSVAHRLALRW